MTLFESSYTGKRISLEPCPFCGFDPEVIMIGNAHTKKRSVKVKCKKCRIERTDGALYHDHDWLLDVAEKNWNQRC